MTKKDMKIWGFTSDECAIIDLEGLAAFDFDPYSHLKVNAMI